MKDSLLFSIILRRLILKQTFKVTRKQICLGGKTMSQKPKVCRYCKGTGEQTCSICDGIEACPHCNGTGKAEN